jgi:hypothetical protein
MRAHSSGRVTSVVTVREMQCAGVRSYILQLYHPRVRHIHVKTPWLHSHASRSPISCMFDVRGSIHHSTIYKEKSNKMQKSVTILLFHTYMKGHAVAHLVEALRYKPEGRGFDSRYCHWNFYWHNPSGLTIALGLTLPLTEMSTRNISWG